MLEINIDDVINVLNTCKPYLIALGVILALAVVITIAVMKLPKSKKKFVRAQSWIAFLLAFVVIVNMICWGPMSSLISLTMGKGSISEESSKQAIELCRRVAEEGTVLLKNEDNILPLKDTVNLNVFGWASTNPCYGGTGSGSISDQYDTVTLLEGLENAGFKLNKELSDFYREYKSERPKVEPLEQDWTLPEPTVDSYSEELLKNAKDFSDTAVVVITRVGGEGADLPTDLSKVKYTDNSKEYKDFEKGEHYLELNHTERDMVDMVCSNFENVIVVYNGTNTMELGFLDEYEQIKGAVWCSAPGQSGFDGLGKILNGEVNPSGKTNDTFVRDVLKTPTANNFGNFTYENMKDYKGYAGTVERTPTFVNYTEGIYVGYRFYETAAEEGAINYEETVLYPFGYGLSYTEFSQKIGNFEAKDGVLNFDVTVTNTGDTAGKDVVQVYYNPPYTNGGIEKSSVNLLTFAKTKLLKPNESQTLTFSVNQEEMASYDHLKNKCYVLEEGEYGISICLNAHEVLDEVKYQVKDTVVYDESNPRSTDDTVAVNQFDEAAGDVVYLSRKDKFANYEEATKAPESLIMPEKYKEKFVYNGNYNSEEHNNPDDEMPKTGVDSGMKLADLRGADYDDPKWETLLDQLTVDEMNDMIALGGFQTAAANSVEKISTVDCDGPASIINNFTKTSSIGFPSAVTFARTWNVELAKEFGECIGRMADEMGVSGWYAPAMNTHRSPFAGRNFEYYSEDGVLGGKMAANSVIGAEKYGVYAYIKHFALNDQETNRTRMLCTWSNEQAIREIYLKPFEIAVKEGHAKAVMSAFNYIGTEYAGASNALLNTVLRDEWGFRGMVLTDYFGGYGYQNADQEVRNGNDMMLVAYELETNYVKDTKSATSVQAMRQACKNIMYTVVNSRAYDVENLETGLMTWQIVVIVIDTILAAGLILLEIVAIKRFKKRNTELAKEVKAADAE